MICNNYSVNISNLGSPARFGPAVRSCPNKGFNNHLRHAQHSQFFPTFHTSHIKPWNFNNDSKFPSHTVEKPCLIDIDCVEEFLVDSIINHKKIGRGFQYLVLFKGYGHKDDCWILSCEMENNEALNIYWRKNPQNFKTLNTGNHSS